MHTDESDAPSSRFLKLGEIGLNMFDELNFGFCLKESLVPIIALELSI
jgi:hypothetical protein